jgi:Skp family chaperone for outer membrane proteins
MPPIRARAVAAALLALAPAAAVGQRPDPLLSMGVAPPVVVIDQERLFLDSAFGRRVTATLEGAAAALSEENRAYEEILMAEERALTDQRPGMAAEEFRALADAFDVRVEGIRRQQEAKGRALADFRDAEQQRFFDAALPVVAQVVAESGAVVVLDTRAILLAVDEIDITDRVLARIDAELGDGAAGAPALGIGQPAQAPAPRPLPPPAAGDNSGPPLALPDPVAPEPMDDTPQ